MTFEFCPLCGARMALQSNRCRACDFGIDSDYYPYLYDETGTPDTWDDGGIPDDVPDEESGSEYQ